MSIDHHARRQEAAPLLLPWGMPGGERSEGVAGALSVWLGGGAVLLAWTGLALLLTA